MISNITIPTNKNEKWKYVKISDEVLALFEIKPTDLHLPIIAISDRNIIEIKNGDITKLELEKNSGISFEITTNTKLVINITKPASFNIIHNNSKYLNCEINIAAENVSIFEEFCDNGEVHLENSCLKINLADSADLNHYRIQNNSINTHIFHFIEANLGNNANYNLFNLSLGGVFSKQEVAINFNGIDSNAVANGLNIGSKNQYHDIYILSNHKNPQNSSKQNYKQIGFDNSKMVFYGKIFVDHIASQTNATQLNKNLILSKNAQIFTRPELKILNRNIICNHGATIGNLDENAIYYLESRGINRIDGTKMMIEAFLESVLSEIKDDKIKGIFKRNIETCLIQN